MSHLPPARPSPPPPPSAPRKPGSLVPAVSEFSKQTGDFRSLSAADIQVLALTLQLEAEHGDGRPLRTEPRPQVPPAPSFMLANALLVRGGGSGGKGTLSRACCPLLKSRTRGRLSLPRTPQVQLSLTNLHPEAPVDVPGFHVPPKVIVRSSHAGSGLGAEGLLLMAVGRSSASPFAQPRLGAS